MAIVKIFFYVKAKCRWVHCNFNTSHWLQETLRAKLKLAFILGMQLDRIICCSCMKEMLVHYTKYLKQVR